MKPTKAGVIPIFSAAACTEPTKTSLMTATKSVTTTRMMMLVESPQPP